MKILTDVLADCRSPPILIFRDKLKSTLQGAQSRYFIDKCDMLISHKGTSMVEDGGDNHGLQMTIFTNLG